MIEDFDNETPYAYLAFKRPGESSSYYYKCRFIESQDLSFIREYDFVFAPFSTDSESIIFLEYIEQVGIEAFNSETLPIKELHETPRSKYSLQFKNLQTIIKEGDIEKLVLSRIKAHRDNDLLPQDIFNLLLTKYPDAFSYLILIPNRLCWIGASPEPVLKESNNAFLSSALAGTQALSQDPKEVVWGLKEREEHAFIETYLEAAFQELNFSYKKSERYTVSAAEVCHIRSDFYLDKSNDITQLLPLLHPGPALSGYPKDEAVSMIPEIESHDRSYYTGYFGTTSKGMGLSLYANLRCMALYKDGAELYLGGGITKDSDENSEWMETELKSRTMGSVLELVSKLNARL